MLSISKEISIACAHRLTNYVGPCANIHGHNYRVVVHFSGVNEDNGMVKDFRFVKDMLMEEIHDKYDHALIIHDIDETLLDFAECERMKHVVFPHNPTAENMARVFFEILVKAGVTPYQIDVWETPSSCASFGGE